MNRLSLGMGLCLALSWLVGCSSASFDSPTKVQRLRLLALKAEPPEIAPAQSAGAPPSASPSDRAQLTSLVADPAQLSDPARRATVIYLACTPDPANPVLSPCDAMDEVTDPAGLATLAGAGSGACGGSGASGGAGAAAGLGLGAVGGVTFSGLESCDAAGCIPAVLHPNPDDPGASLALPGPSYAVPPELQLSQLPPGAPARVLGVQVAILALVLEASPDELFAGKDLCAVLSGFPERLRQLLAERESATATKRILVRGPDATDEPNRNPSIAGIVLGGEVVAESAGAAAPVAPGDKAKLTPLLPAGSEASFQSYSKYDASGALLETARESWAYSWFTTVGSFEKKHTKSAGEGAIWDVPEDLAGSATARVYAVVRDLRGGMDWAVREVLVRAP